MTRPAAGTEPFAVADELTCYYDRPSEPANVHLEVRLPGRLDQAVLTAAVAGLLEAERGLRARRAGGRHWQRRYRWEFAARPDTEPLVVSAYSDQADLDRQRDAFVSLPPPLDSAPTFLLLLASGPGGDHLLLNAHHARFDGLACLRLLTELGAAYGGLARLAGRAAARPDGEPAEPDAGPQPGPGSRSEQAEALRQLGPAGAETRFQIGVLAAEPGRPGEPARRRPRGRIPGRVARIAPGREMGRRRPRPGYGTCLLTWEGPGLAAAAREAGASVNDMLLTALMMTVADWNASRRPPARSVWPGRPVPPGLIRITMPVGDQVQAGPAGAWANRSRLAAVAARPGPRSEPGALLADVARQTPVAKRRQGPQVGLVSRALTAAPGPAVAKHAALRAALRIAGPVLCDTALLSNLGQAAAPAFGDLVGSEMWFSTSAHLPRGLSVGVVSSAGRLRCTFRYRSALLSAADAAEFAGRYGKALDQLVSAKAGR
ncbi:MAG: hypothetical protein ACR2FU_19290 [Streptosporangiaceae bacterium]